MLDNEKIGAFIASTRKNLGMTQQQLADKLNVTFQSVSKWENGTAYPSTEILFDLATVFNVTVDEVLRGEKRDINNFSYSKAGVDIAYTDSIKREMKKLLQTEDKRVLNGIGPFASLYDIKFASIKDPVLVLKSEEPGSKQKLAMEYGYSESICHDMINHLVNDIAVMGAKPLAVLDTIVCSNAEKDTINSLVKGISEAAKENECSLVGGETSIQPSVIDAGVYVLTSSIVGIVDKSKIIDGSAIKAGDAVIAVASNGLHTNGYALVRMLMDQKPHIKLDRINGITFIEQIMKPHTPYYKAIKGLFDNDLVHGIAHITGGGIEGNLCRIIPDGLCADIDLSCIKLLDIFKYIKKIGCISEDEMIRTFNCGVGLVLVSSQNDKMTVIEHVSKHYDCYEIGSIKAGTDKICFNNRLNWL